MNKKFYSNAEIDIQYFEKKDVIVASGVTPPDTVDPNENEIKGVNDSYFGG